MTTFKIGATVVITGGLHKGLYGKVSEPWFQISQSDWPEIGIKLQDGRSVYVGHDNVKQYIDYHSPVKYFYTTEYPHRWGSGPLMNQWNPDKHEYIQSLEEAKEIAERLAVGGYSESRCVTTYGVTYTIDEKEDGKAERNSDEYGYESK